MVNAWLSAAPPRPARRQLDVVTAGAAQRRRAEDFIRSVYADHYGAGVAGWAPTLVTLSTDGALAAAAGYRDARTPLYLENYLDRPVHELIAARAGQPVAREDIVEVGHFASRQPGEGRRLLLLLARHLADEGYRWVVSTATRELRELLMHVGLRPLALAPADPARVPSAGTWGTYYDHEPVVVAGDLLRGLAALEKRHAAP